jgi:hypothetical protein
MDEIRKPSPYHLASDEKLTTMMFYTPLALYRGEAVMKSNIRASLWMRTPASPEYVHILRAQVINLAGGAVKPLHFPEFFLAASNIVAYHVAAPSQPDGYDFDETEVNRVFEAATAVIGNFIFNGSVRITATNTAHNAIFANRSTWVSLYHVEIANPIFPQMGVVKVPLVLLRASATNFGIVPAASS